MWFQYNYTCNSLDSDRLSLQPELYQINLVEGIDKTIRVIEQVASKWEEVATRLHFEGHDIKNIKRNHTDCVEACRTMFMEWLEKKGRRPKTWNTLIKVLEEAAFSEIATDLKLVLEN